MLELSNVDSWIAFQQFHSNVSYLEQELGESGESGGRIGLWVGGLLRSTRLLQEDSKVLYIGPVKVLGDKKRILRDGMFSYSTSPLKKKDGTMGGNRARVLQILPQSSWKFLSQVDTPGSIATKPW